MRQRATFFFSIRNIPFSHGAFSLLNMYIFSYLFFSGAFPGYSSSFQILAVNMENKSGDICGLRGCHFAYGGVHGAEIWGFVGFFSMRFLLCVHSPCEMSKNVEEVLPLNAS